MSYADLSTAAQIFTILASLAIKPDWMHCIALGAAIAPDLKLTNDKSITFSDGSALHPNGRGVYMACEPVKPPMRFGQ